MKIEIFNKDERELKFLVRGVSVPMVNALRRIFIAEMPSLAVDYLKFYKNDSPVFDEIIAHRVGLIPLNNASEIYITPEECGCKEGCEKCSVTLSLEKTGPCTVYSSDLVSGDKDVYPIIDTIPITKLGEGQELKFDAVARIGTAEDHSKWQIANAAYKYVPKIELNLDKCDLCEECIPKCPKNLFYKEKNKLKVRDIYECTMCRACEETCEQGVIKISHENDAFVFFVESYGNMGVNDLVTKALDMLSTKLDQLKNLVDNI
ncbi:MAG TPA: DNA-directed RNA polymerase subunit D [Methanofastidiosum sp.]|jgi:DNA-directed RNA polymerase subunit D|nr:DNA-directed RNA polymerase subunit D [Methanofastidiosum sp.]HOG74047.1 DNA-directed RNA polymerase subunit D [Methanofastidiosum sp.]HRZ19273.1 DNA-directed RNA polymerase subunit D [Methanofastidiosum sp.]